MDPAGMLEAGWKVDPSSEEMWRVCVVGSRSITVCAVSKG